MPESAEVAELGRVIDDLPGTRLMGVLTHAGQSYQGRDVAAMEAFAEYERWCAVTAAQSLRAAGLPCPVVSIGSTPTATHGKNYDGVTEVRCGVYMFGDVFQSEILSCRREDIAVSVLATVIGHRPHLNCALIDAAHSPCRKTAAPAHRVCRKMSALVS